MNHFKPDTSAKRFTFKSFLPQAIVGLLLGGIVGFIIGIEIAPLIVSLLVKPSLFILDPAAILAGLFVIVLCTLGCAILGMYVAIRLSRRAKDR